MSHRTISFDTETRGLSWFNQDEGPFLVTWSDDDGDHLAHCDERPAMAAFQQALRSADTLVAHNLAFDAHQLRHHCGIDVLDLPGRAIDTGLLARVVVPERRSKQDEDAPAHLAGFGLDDLSKTYLPAGQVKISLDEAAKAHGISLKKKGGYHALWQAEPELLEDYAKRDTRATIELLPHLAGHLTDRLRPTWELEREVCPWLIRAEARGVAVDQAKVEPLLADFTAKRDRAYDLVTAELPGVLGDPGDPDAKDDHDALREALLAHGVPLHRTTPTGVLATNRFALQEFAADFPVIDALLTYRTADKFLATYIEPMLGREAVHPSFWQIGAWTGRMSCSRPNMQNIPVRGEGAGELRAMFVPRPGYVFVVSDYDAIEVRLLAHYLHNANYKAMIAAGMDPHAWMASNIWGGTAEMYAKGSANDKLRSMAKNVLFAIVYGAGAPRVMDMLAEAGMESTRDEAKALIKAIKTALPGYRKLNSRVRKKVENVGHVNTIWGRRQPVNKDKAYIGLNALIQGSAADIMKQGIINTGEAVAHLGALPVLFVHDEIVTECPAEHAEECMRLQDQAMAAAFSLDPELLVSSTIATGSYADAK